jgi:general secretion pathway protein N
MKRLVTVGILIFFGVLLATFPARVAYKWFAPAELLLSGIAGSVWNGSAVEGYAGGAYVRNINWQFKPTSLLSGKLGFRTHSNPASGTLSADVGLSPGGDLLLSDLSGNLPLDLLHPAMQQSGIRGDIALQFETVLIRNGVPVVAEGSVTVSDFFVPDLSSARIGDFRAAFQTNDDTVVGSVEDVSGVLDVAGTISLHQDGLYSFVGQVAPTPVTPPSIVNQLRFLGSANERGQHEFRFEGRL